MPQLAQLNIGRLVAETDDPRVAEFMAALDRVNGLAKRMPGFVWIMEGSEGQGNTETKIGGDRVEVPRSRTGPCPDQELVVSASIDDLVDQGVDGRPAPVDHALSADLDHRGVGQDAEVGRRVGGAQKFFVGE